MERSVLLHGRFRARVGADDPVLSSSGPIVDSGAGDKRWVWYVVIAGGILLLASPFVLGYYVLKNG